MEKKLRDFSYLGEQYTIFAEFVGNIAKISVRDRFDNVQISHEMNFSVDRERDVDPASEESDEFWDAASKIAERNLELKVNAMIGSQPLNPFE